MVILVKMTQKRGRRTDSITLDASILSPEKASVIEVRTKLVKKNVEITMIIGDLTITVLMDMANMKDLLNSMNAVTPFLLELGSNRGADTSEKDLYETLTELTKISSLLNTLPQPVGKPKTEGCTPCEERAQKDLSKYFANIIAAYEKGEEVGEAIKKNIDMLRYFAVALQEGGEKAKEAFKKATDFLSHYP